MSLSVKDQQYIWHPYTQMKIADPSIGIVKAEGCILIDEDGNELIDAISSWWVNIHGHNRPELIHAINEQFNKIDHIIFAGFTHEPAVTLAERLVEALSNRFQKIFYSDNGSTAVEVAMKMCIQFWANKGLKKNKFIAFENSYHGDTFGAMSVSSRSDFTNPFNSLLFDIITLPLPDEDPTKTVDELKNLLSREDIAGFIFEPLVLGTAGMKMYSAPVLDELLAICKENDILAIADEVMTGFGRTGTLFAIDQLKNSPDIICMSKGITGGILPLGVTACTQKIYDAFYSDDKKKMLFHGHSYTANPLSCAAAVASLKIFNDPGVWSNIRSLNDSHLQFSEEIKGRFGISCRVTGTILAFEIPSKSEGYFSTIRDKAYRFFLDNGILLRPLGNTIYILPPYTISEKQLKIVYKQIIEFLATEV